MIYQKHNDDEIINALRKSSIELMKENARRLLRDEIEKYQAELARYKQEAERILEICRHRPCIFEVNEYNYRNHKNVWKWVSDWRHKCPQICPKWRGGNQDEGRNDMGGII